MIESYNLIIAACFSDSDESDEAPCVLVIDLCTTKILQEIKYKPLEYPSAISWHSFGAFGDDPAKLKVYIGTSVMPSKESGENESYSPQKGALYAYNFDVELRCEQEVPLNGAVYDIQDFVMASQSYLVLGINAIVRIYLIKRDENMLDKVSEVDSQIITYKIKVVHERPR